MISYSIELEGLMDRAEFLRKENPAEAIAIYRSILDRPNESDDIIKIKETCTFELAEVYGEMKDIQSLSNLLESSRTFFTVVSKAKAAKIGKMSDYELTNSQINY